MTTDVPQSSSENNPTPEQDASTSPENSSNSEGTASLSAKGFYGLLVTQFLGAMNDNILKQIMVMAVEPGKIWEPYREYKGFINIIFAMPFILGSAISGQLADKNNKQWIALHMKNAEILLAIIGGVAIYYGSFYGTLFCFFLLSAQSTIFGPAKYGMIPELVPVHQISRSNGFISMTTNLAAIAGFILGASCIQYHQNSPLLALEVLLLVAIFGRLAVSWIPPLQAKNPELRYNWNIGTSYTQTFREMRETPSMLACSFGWGFFYFAGSLTLLLIPSFGTPLKLSDIQVGIYLSAGIAVAIGCGSIVSGKLARGKISFTSLWFGGIGMALAFLSFFFIPMTFNFVFGAMMILGFFAGLYVVPIMSFIQMRSPVQKRGQYLGANNLLSFVMIALSGLYDYLLNQIPLLSAPESKFGVCGFLTLIMVFFLRNVKKSV